VAQARVLRRGRTVVHVDVDATAGSRSVAHALVTYKLG
jgi:acyl-coenzyme A thioesterase PaaI-like protein